MTEIRFQMLRTILRTVTIAAPLYAAIAFAALHVSAVTLAQAQIIATGIAGDGYGWNSAALQSGPPVVNSVQ